MSTHEKVHMIKASLNDVQRPVLRKVAASTPPLVHHLCLRPTRRPLAGWRRLFPGTLLLLGLALLLPCRSRAGFTMEMNVIRSNPYGYSFAPNLLTNALTPDGLYGDYQVTSYGYPTNGASAMYHYDTNGLTWLGSGNWGYNDFDSMIHDLAYGPWAISFTNATTTNAFYFHVIVNLASNDVPYITVNFPTNGEAGVPTQPVFLWSGPPNYSDLVIYSGSNATNLPVTQDTWSGWTLAPGTNSFNVHYDSYDTNYLLASVPLDAGSNLLAGWSSTVHLQDYAVMEFTVEPAQPVRLSPPSAAAGTLQLSFLSQSFYTHSVQYRTNLLSGAHWQTYSNVAGDGKIKTLALPFSLFSPAGQGFVRVATQ